MNENKGTEIVMKIDGYDGEVKYTGFEKWIHVYLINYVSTPHTGHANGMDRQSGLDVITPWHRSVPKIFEATYNNKPLKNITIAVIENINGKIEKHSEFTLRDVTILSSRMTTIQEFPELKSPEKLSTNYNVSSSSLGQKISFSPTVVTLAHTVTEGGKSSGRITGGWDFSKNQAASA